MNLLKKNQFKNKKIDLKLFYFTIIINIILLSSKYIQIDLI